MDELFGTDGIRGPFGLKSITPEFFLQLGFALGELLGEKSQVVLGRDSRASSTPLQAALTAGLLSSGLDVFDVGIVPTPAVSFLTVNSGSHLGLMITASHNPSADNGLKIFSASGQKIDSFVQKRINKLLTTKRQFDKSVGSLHVVFNWQQRYLDHLKSFYPSTSLRGLTVALDCAHGALYKIAPQLFSSLGAKVILTGDRPTGQNINEGVGALYPEKICALVNSSGADLGLSFDGDGDRLLLCYQGQLIPAEHILLFLYDFFQKTEHYQGGIASTVLANGALPSYLHSKNISFVKTAVGDRHLSQALEKHKWSLGAEPSGHFLLFDKAKSADALLVALTVAIGLFKHQFSFEKYEKECPLYWQQMMNIPCSDKTLVLESKEFQKTVASLREQYQDVEILVRASGTEPKIRVSAQSPSMSALNPILEEIAKAAQQILDLVAA